MAGFDWFSNIKDRCLNECNFDVWSTVGMENDPKFSQDDLFDLTGMPDRWREGLDMGYQNMMMRLPNLSMNRS